MSYVEPVDQQKLVYGAIRGMLNALDPHTTYLDPEEYQILESDTEGRFAGVGVEVSIRDGWLTVLTVFRDGPAAKAGLLPGDRFLAIDDKDARDLRLMDAVQRMRGKEGTTVKVLIRREGVEKAIERKLKRAFIDLEPLEWKTLPGRVVYVKLNAFREKAVRDLRDALDVAAKRLRGQGGIAGVMLDLRDNGGGLLSQAISVADEFLTSGVIVSTRGRGGQALQTHSARRGGTRPDWPMVVLINSQSASASEIVAAALRDHSRAVLVGTRSFGKGSVQDVIELPDGSALKLTIARYYSPSGISIQARGIAPDVEIRVAANGGPQEAFREDSLEGYLAPGDNGKGRKRPEIKIPAAQRTATPDALKGDVQAIRAYNVLSGLIAER